MRRNPRKYREELGINLELDLSPMMNLVMVLIPCLLISIAFLKLTKIEVMLASSGPNHTGEQTESLGLTLSLTPDGYILKARQPIELSGFEALQEPNGTLVIPVVEKTVSCAHYVGTWPPPRHLNRFTNQCDDPTTSRLFRVYDQARLTEVLHALKRHHPVEYDMTITANHDVEFEALANAMDASRSGKVADVPTGPLFPNVALEPCEF